MEDYTSVNRRLKAVIIDEALKEKLSEEGFVGAEVGKVYCEQEDGQRFLMPKENFDRLFISTKEANSELLAVTAAYTKLIGDHIDLLNKVGEYLKEIGCA